MALGEGDVVGASEAAPDSGSHHLTRGFLFADLRGYTAYVEAHGDDAAANLLEAYRQLVREVVRRTGGAEIRTEGDSFYVVFPAASAAVRCGLALVAAAGDASVADPDRPIRVGVGVHAGETAATAEGYVGSAVNLAARLCAIAGPGEVLVSDTVRGLTRTSGEVTFTSRGRKQLKGIAEPIAVYAATPAAAGGGVAPPVRLPLGSRLLGFGDPRRVAVAVGGTALAVVLAALLVAGAFGGGFGASPTPTGVGGSLGTGTSGTTASPIADGAATPIGTPLTADIEEDFNRAYALTPDTYEAPQLPGGPRLAITDGGWSAQASFPGKLVLGRTSSPDDRFTLQWLDRLAPDACGVQPPITIGLDPEGQFLAWAHAAKGLRLGPAVTRQFGDLSATQVDVTVVDAYACQYTSPPSVSLGPCHFDSCLAIAAGGPLRLEVSSRDGQLILILIEAPSAAEFDTFEPLAEKLLSTLTFPS